MFLRIGLILIGVVLLADISFDIYMAKASRGKSGYVYIEKIYDGFKGKLETENGLKAVENRQRNMLDTLKLEIIALESKLKNGSDPSTNNLLQIKQGDYNKLVEEFSNYNSNESEKHVQNLLKQINQYVKDYGQDNNYDYIFGASGNGSLMYATDGKDLTEDVIKYINKKYEGK